MSPDDAGPSHFRCLGGSGARCRRDPSRMAPRLLNAPQEPVLGRADSPTRGRGMTVRDVACVSGLHSSTPNLLATVDFGRPARRAISRIGTPASRSLRGDAMSSLQERGLTSQPPTR